MIWRFFAKILSYLIFGLFCVPSELVILPLLLIFVHPASRFRHVGRHFISFVMQIMVLIMRFLGLVSVEADKSACKKIKGMIIAPNHPSFLDVVILYGLFPGASCVVKPTLKRTLVGMIVSLLYAPTSMEIDTMDAQCSDALQAGDNVIIFPEGTRTADPRHLDVKRGVCRVSRLTGAPILPVSIFTGDMRGLRKHDRWWWVSREGKYRYRFVLHDPILPSAYSGVPRAVEKAMRGDLAAVLQTSLDAWDKEHTS